MSANHFRRKAREDHTLEYLRECLTPDFEQGTLRWAVRPEHHFRYGWYQRQWNRRHAGNVAGSNDRVSGWRISIDGITHSLGRLLWAFHHDRWPERHILHKNGDGSDYKIDNLVERPRTNTLPKSTVERRDRNGRPLRSSSRSGVVGVYPVMVDRRHTGRWLAKSKGAYLGTFGTIEEAAEAKHRADLLLGHAEVTSEDADPPTNHPIDPGLSPVPSSSSPSRYSPPPMEVFDVDLPDFLK